jgi:hypothetical protein
MKQEEVIPAEEIKEHKTRVEQLKASMSAIKVTSQEELTAVAGHVGEVKKLAKIVKEARDKYIAPAKAIIDQAKADFDPFINACIEIEADLKKKAQVFLDAEDARIAAQTKKEIDKVETGYQKPETAAAKIADIGPVETKVSGDHGTLSRSKVATAIIEDESKIPDEYWIPRTLDMAKINKVTKAGGIIPGVRIEMKSQMNMRAK